MANRKNQFLILYITSILLVLILVSQNVPVFADIHVGSLITNTSQGESKKIAVQLSQQCITALKNHVKTSCPTYKILGIVDNTNPEYYGKLVNDSNGFIQRSKTLAPDYYNVVMMKDWVIAVDPTQQFINGVNTKMIIIIPLGTLNGYAMHDQSIGNNHTRTEYHDRYVDSTCKEARITYSEALYKDTISYLESGCKTTSFIDHEIKNTGNSPFNLNNPYSSRILDSYLMSVLHGHKSFVSSKIAGGLGPLNCVNKQCNYTDPYAKVGYR